MSFLGIKLQPDVARLFREIDVPGEREDTAHLHITILYLGDNISVKELAKAMVATYQVTEHTNPFWVKASCVSHFPVEEGQPYPIIAPIQSPKLMDLRKALARSFTKSKVEYNKKHKIYHPHVTLSFNEEAVKKTKIEPIEWSVQELVLWGGTDGDNRIYTTFPLEIRKNETIECQCVR